MSTVLRSVLRSVPVSAKMAGNGMLPATLRTSATSAGIRSFKLVAAVACKPSSLACSARSPASPAARSASSSSLRSLLLQRAAPARGYHSRAGGASVCHGQSASHVHATYATHISRETRRTGDPGSGVVGRLVHLGSLRPSPCARPHLRRTFHGARCIKAPPERQATTITAMASQDAAFRIAIVLDITSSMAKELSGVKDTVRALAELLQDLPVPLALAILTLTEDSRGCYVSCKEFGSQEGLQEARTYVQNIRLAHPPDHPHLDACGDDGPENYKAGLLRLTDLEPMPTIAFLIADASPHMAASRLSSTHAHELEWLQDRGLTPSVASDLYRVFQLVEGHYAGNLVLNCVAYSGAPHDVYGSLVQRTGGMLMQPVSREPRLLAKGMLDVIRTLLAAMPEGVAGEAAVSSLEGFQLYDVSGLPRRECEQDPGGTVVRGDNEALFAIAMERLVTVCGKKWTKRALGMAAPAQQLEFVWRTARYVAARRSTPSGTAAVVAAEETAAAGELGALLDLRERILEELPAEQRGHFSISPEDINALAAAAATVHATPAAVAPISAISLESVGDALADDADWSDWLATVMRLLHGYPMRLQLPLDKDGKPDFMDAWSSVCLALGVDRISAADFMQLVGDSTSVTGPTDKRQHNALLLLVEPQDTLATLVFRIASGTQVINYVTGVLMGARGFLPNLHPGTAASCLMRLLSSPQPLTSFETRQAAAIAHTLRSMHRTPAVAVAQQLADGQANPADNISKLLAAALRLDPHTQLRSALRLVLEEWVGMMVSRHYGRGPEADAEYRASLARYITLEAVMGTGGGPAGTYLSAAEGAGVDPLTQVHALELQDRAQLLGSFRPDWQARLAARLREGEAASDLEPHPVWAQFTRCAGATLSLLLPTNTEGEHAGEGVTRVWPEWEAGVFRALLLRHRTARYRCINEEGAKEPRWEALSEEEQGSSAELVLQRLMEAHAQELRGYKLARAEQAEARLLATAAAQVVRLSQELEGDSAGEALVTYLRDLYLDMRLLLNPEHTTATQAAADSTTTTASTTAAASAVAAPTSAVAAVHVRPASAPKGPLATMIDGLEHRLDRTCVPQLLEALPPSFQITGPLMQALVVGDWTTTPPQCLRRSPAVLQRCSELGLVAALTAMRAAERCKRTVGCNRLGHSASRQYPGPSGWTKQYAEERVADRPARKSYVAQMQRYTEFAEWAKAQAAAVAAAGEEGGSLPEGVFSALQLLGRVEAALAAYEDANRLDDKVQPQVEALLGRRVLAAAAVELVEA